MSHTYFHMNQRPMQWMEFIRHQHQHMDTLVMASQPTPPLKVLPTPRNQGLTKALLRTKNQGLINHTFPHSANGPYPEKKSLNFILPTKYSSSQKVYS